MPVRKGVIAAAGFGTRFLPATKTLPKEMLPLIDRPLIHYIVEEAVQAGVDHLAIITSRGKSAMEDYFDLSPALEQFLEHKGDRTRLEEVRRIGTMAEVTYIRQKEQRGLGHAVLTAQPFVDNDPFFVYLPDDIIHHPISATQQMLQVYERHPGSYAAVEEVPLERLSSYGIVDGEKVEEGLFRLRGLVEKPSPGRAPSNLGIVGRYIFTPAIFDCLQQATPGALGEIQLTDGMALLAQRQPMFAYRLRGTRYDVGTPLGLLQAAVELALQRPDLGPAMVQWLKGLQLK